MANFNKSSSDLPIVDADGNPISSTNPLTLLDCFVRLIDDDDLVLGSDDGDPLDSHTDSPYNWALLGLFLRDIYLDDKIDNLDIGVENASVLVRGIIELATVAEVVGLSDQFRAVTPYLLGEALKGVDAQATVSQRGTAEIANQIEGRSGTDNEKIMPSLRVLDALRNGTPFASTTTNKGAIELSTLTELKAATLTNRAITPNIFKAFLEDSVRHDGNITLERTFELENSADDMTWMPTLNELWVRSGENVDRYSVSSDGIIAYTSTHQSIGPTGGGSSSGDIEWMPTLNEVWLTRVNLGQNRRYSVTSDGGVTLHSTFSQINFQNSLLNQLYWMPTLNEVWWIRNNSVTRRTIDVNGDMTANGTITFSGSGNIAGFVRMPTLNELWVLESGNSGDINRFNISDSGVVGLVGTNEIESSRTRENITFIPFLNEIWICYSSTTLERYRLNQVIEWAFT